MEGESEEHVGERGEAEGHVELKREGAWVPVCCLNGFKKERIRVRQREGEICCALGFSPVSKRRGTMGI